MIRRVLITSALLLGGLLNNASVASEVQNIRSATLKNGMRMYVMADNRFPVVMHMLVYKVGGMDDPPGFSGMAHFLEHMMFSGTENVKDFAKTVNGFGGKFNAYTLASHTAYYEIVQKQYLPKVMSMEADRMHGITFKDEPFERERNVVREERYMRTESTPRGILSEDVVNAFYRNGYGMPLVGWEHEIANYNKATVKSFYNKYYNPGNAILFIVGDVDFDNVVKLSNKYYGGIKNKRELVRRISTKIEPPRRTSAVITMEHPSVTDSEMCILYDAPNIGENSDFKEYCVSSIAADIVAGHEFGILYNKLVREKAIAVDVSVSYRAAERSNGMIAIEIVPKFGISPEEVYSEVREIMTDLMESGVTEEYVDNAKYRSLADLTYSLDDLENRAWFYANMVAVGAAPIPSEEVIDIVKNTSVDDVNRIIKNVFGKPSVRGYLVPEDDASNAKKGATSESTANPSVPEEDATSESPSYQEESVTSEGTENPSSSEEDSDSQDFSPYPSDYSGKSSWIEDDISGHGNEVLYEK
ncbi:M16 family metallopeptidase [Anaplasma bovis]|uniref:M16 family metallopeptidase n=1 Tax=Anaplasma bovis TaxID=186733 RepID=UPI002FF2E493